MAVGNYNLQNLLAFAKSGQDDAKLNSQFYNRYSQLRNEALNTFDEGGLESVRQNAINYYEKNKANMDDWTIDAWTTLVGEYNIDESGVYAGGDLNSHIDKVKGHNMGMEIDQGYKESVVELMEKYNHIAGRTTFQAQKGVDDWGDPIYVDLDYSVDTSEEGVDKLNQLRNQERNKLKDVLENTVGQYNLWRETHQTKYADILKTKTNDFNILNSTSELFGLSVEFIDDDNLFDIEEKKAMLQDIANPTGRNRNTLKYLKKEELWDKEVESGYMKRMDETYLTGQNSKALLNIRNKYINEYDSKYIVDGKEREMDERERGEYLEWMSQPALVDGQTIPHPSGKTDTHITIGDLFEDQEVQAYFSSAGKTYKNSKEILSNLNTKLFDLTDGRNYLQTINEFNLDKDWQGEVAQFSGIESGNIPMSYEHVVGAKKDRVRFNSEGFPIWEEPVVEKVEPEEIKPEEKVEPTFEPGVKSVDKHGRTVELNKKGEKIVQTRTGYTIVYPGGAAPEGTTVKYSDSSKNKIVWENLFKHKNRNDKIPRAVVKELAIELFGSDDSANTKKVMDIFVDQEEKYAKEKGVKEGEYKKVTTEGAIGVKSVDYQFIPKGQRVKKEKETYTIGSGNFEKEYTKNSKEGEIISGWEGVEEGYAPIDGKYFREDASKYINKVLLKNHNNDIEALIDFAESFSNLGVDMVKNKEIKSELVKVGNRIRQLVDEENMPKFQNMYMGRLNKFAESVGINKYGGVQYQTKVEGKKQFSTKEELMKSYRNEWKKQKKNNSDFAKRYPNFGIYWKYNKPEKQLQEIESNREFEKLKKKMNR